LTVDDDRDLVRVVRDVDAAVGANELLPHVDRVAVLPQRGEPSATGIAEVDREEAAVLGDVAVRVVVAPDREARVSLLASREVSVRDVEPQWLAGPARSVFAVGRRADRPLVAVLHE